MKTVRVSSDAEKKLQQALAQLGDKVLKVGWFRGQVYPEPPHANVAAIAAQNEYGNPGRNIPARPFFRPAITHHKAEWSGLFERGMKSVILGQRSVYEVYEGVGLKAAADVRGAIAEPLVPWQPLSPITIAARLARHSNQSTIGNLWKPLIDTGLMYGTLIHAVEKE